ncbi:ABC transporter permease subunit [Listeria monocytogenes]|nr:ABC transporter permease subunit [Listeria monocytogenes]
MNNVAVLVKKEWKEYLKEFRIFWLPIAFIGIGIMQPVTMKMLPKLVGGEVSGLIIDPNAAIQSGNQIFSGTFTQFNQFGLIITVVALMGAVAKERSEGVLDILFSKPVGKGSYLFSKYFSNSILLTISLIIGSLAGVYYTNIYYSNVNMKMFIKALSLYGLWFLFIVTAAIFFSSIAKSQIQAAALTLGLCFLLVIIGGQSNNILEIINPSYLSSAAELVMQGNNLPGNLIYTSGFCLLYIEVMYISSYLIMKKLDK